MNRRDFFKRSAAAAVGVAFGGLAAPAVARELSVPILWSGCEIDPAKVALVKRLIDNALDAQEREFEERLFASS